MAKHMAIKMTTGRKHAAKRSYAMIGLSLLLLVVVDLLVGLW